MVLFVKKKFKLGPGWALQCGSPKLFYSLNLVTYFEIGKFGNRFLWPLEYVF